MASSMDSENIACMHACMHAHGTNCQKCQQTEGHRHGPMKFDEGERCVGGEEMSRAVGEVEGW